MARTIVKKSRALLYRWMLGVGSFVSFAALVVSMANAAPPATSTASLPSTQTTTTQSTPLTRAYGGRHHHRDFGTQGSTFGGGSGFTGDSNASPFAFNPDSSQVTTSTGPS